MFCRHCGAVQEVFFTHIRRAGAFLSYRITWDPKRRDGLPPVELCAKCQAQDSVLLLYLKEPVKPSKEA